MRQQLAAVFWEAETTTIALREEGQQEEERKEKGKAEAEAGQMAMTAAVEEAVTEAAASSSSNSTLDRTKESLATPAAGRSSTSRWITFANRMTLRQLRTSCGRALYLQAEAVVLLRAAVVVDVAATGRSGSTDKTRAVRAPPQQSRSS
jgi:hypothetical protein